MNKKRIVLGLVALSLVFLLAVGASASFFDALADLFGIRYAAPEIVNISVYPQKVMPDSVMLTTVEVEDKYGISEAIAIIPNEKGSDTIKMHLISGSSKKGVYQCSWIEHDAKNEKWYNTTVIVTNVKGMSSEAKIEWQDPTKSHPASEVTAGTFDSGNFSFPDRVGIGTTNPIAKLEVKDSGTGGLSLNVTGDLYVNDTANGVGIGTTNPAGALQVLGDEVRIGTPTCSDAYSAGDLCMNGSIESEGAIFVGDMWHVGSKLRMGMDTMSSNQTIVGIATNDAGATNRYYIKMWSDVDGTLDAEFRFATNGTAYADGTWQTGGADLAEIFYFQDISVEQGDLVAFVGEEILGKSGGKPYDSSIAGVISTNPGFLGGVKEEEEENPHFKPVALIGRAPVKVNLENGPIEVGDPLTSSSQPGVAMKATKPGIIIGKALESFDGECNDSIVVKQEGKEYKVCKIMTFVNVGYWEPENNDDSSKDISELENEVMKLRYEVAMLRKELAEVQK